MISVILLSFLSFITMSIFSNDDRLLLQTNCWNHARAWLAFSSSAQETKQASHKQNRSHRRMLSHYACWEKAFTLYQFILGHAGKLYGSQDLLAAALLSQVFLFCLATVKKTIQFTVTEQVPVTRKSWEAAVAPLSDFPLLLLPMETTHRCTSALKEEVLKTKTNRKRHALLSTQLIL